MSVHAQATLPTSTARHQQRQFRLSEQRGHPVVLYFYPKDNTPGCTTEGRIPRPLSAVPEGEMRDLRRVARQREVARGLQGEDGFPFELLSDAEETACKLFGVIKMKNMYGRQVRGIERSTFVIDAAAQLAREWRGVKVPGHAQEVLEFVKSLLQ